MVDILNAQYHTTMASYAPKYGNRVQDQPHAVKVQYTKSAYEHWQFQARMI
jgi:hypothetical protein